MFASLCRRLCIPLLFCMGMHCTPVASQTAPSQRLGERPSIPLSPSETEAALRDPAARAKLAARERAQIERTHADLPRILLLTRAQAQAFFRLLTQIKLAELELTHGLVVTVNPENFRAGQLRRIRQQLGERSFQQYLDFRYAQRERNLVAELAKELGTQDALPFEQRERLIALLLKERQRNREIDWLTTGYAHLPLAEYPGLEKIRAAEGQLEEAEQLGAAIRTVLPSVLNTRQIDAFVRLEGVELQRLRTQVRAAIENSRYRGKPLAGIGKLPPRILQRMQLKIALEINGIDYGVLRFETRHGEKLSFPAPLGLMGEIVAFFYEGNYMLVRFRFFEPMSAGNRLVIDFRDTAYEAIVPMRPGLSHDWSSASETYAVSLRYTATPALTASLPDLPVDQLARTTLSNRLLKKPVLDFFNLACKKRGFCSAGEIQCLRT